MEHIVKKTLDGIEYCFPKEVYDNYFINIVIHEVDDKNCSVDIIGVGTFRLPMSITKAVECINDNDDSLINELFKIKDFPKSKFLAQKPPPKFKRRTRKTFWERLIS